MTRITRALSQALGERALLRFQDPVQLNNDSEPEPDIAVVALNSRAYEDHHPTPDEVYWLIEVKT